MMDKIIGIAIRRVEYPGEYELVSRMIALQRLNSLKKWAARLCIAQELYQLHNDLKIRMEKSVVDLLTKRVIFLYFFLLFS